MRNANNLTMHNTPEPERRHPFGVTSVTLWGIAILCTALDESIAPEHIRILTFTSDMDRLAIGSAVLCTLLWYLDRHLIGHVTDWRIGSEYAYRKGFRDGVRHADHAGRPELHLVEPPRQRINGHSTPETQHSGEHWL